MVQVKPATASLALGATQSFTATVTGTTNEAVTWSVDGLAGGNASTGTISASGVYVAPQILPTPASVTITAASAADPSATSSAAVTLQSNLLIDIRPASANVLLQASQTFTASVTGPGNPDTDATWMVNGQPGGSPATGTIASSGGDTAVYTAPATPPGVAIEVMAASVADPSKMASANVTVTCPEPDGINPATATLSLGESLGFSAQFCAPAGTAIAWDVNGVAGGNGTYGTIVSTGQDTASYNAPQDIPAGNPVTIHATTQQTPPRTAAAVVTLVSNLIIFLTPPSASTPEGGRVTFTPTVVNSADTTVNWLVEGVANGDAANGQVCVHNSNPCVAPAGPSAAMVDYLAPSTTPTSDPVTLTAVSNADPSREASAQITVTGPVPVSVSVSPAYAFLAASGGTQFQAAVSGTANAAVTWSLALASGPACTAALCGTIDVNGNYVSPAQAPSPNEILATATSVADPTKSGTATIAVTSGAVIEQLLPSSVISGIPVDIPLEIVGVNFVAGSGNGATSILVNGEARATTCDTAQVCFITLDPADLASATTFTMQAQNPGTPAPLSNTAPFVVVAFSATPDVITLTSGAPAATGKDIVVAEPSTNGSGAAPLNVNFAGPLTISGGDTNCALNDAPITVIRPPSGSAVTSICVQGDNLAPGFLYQFSGPSDIGIVVTSLENLFPNLMELDLTISSDTEPGLRTLFITDSSNDKAVATGLLEVE